MSFNTIAGLAATQTPTNQDCGTCLPNLIDGCMENPNGSSRQMRHQPYERFDSFYEGPSCQHQLALGFSRWERPDDQKTSTWMLLVTNTANTIGSPAILFGGSLLSGFVQQFGTHTLEFSLKTTFINPRSKS